MSAKPILLGIIWLLGRCCVAQPVQEACFVCEGERLSAEINYLALGIDACETDFPRKPLALGACALSESCGRVYAAQAHTGPPITGDTFQIRVPYHALCTVIRQVDSLGQRCLEAKGEGGDQTSFQILEEDFPAAHAAFSVLIRHIHPAKDSAYTAIDKQAFIPVFLPPYSGADGFLSSVPDSVLWPLMADWDSVPVGSIAEGMVQTETGKPVPGVMVYDTVGAGIALTDQRGYFRLWQSAGIAREHLRFQTERQYPELSINKNIYILKLMHYPEDITDSGNPFSWEQLLARYRRRIPKNTSRLPIPVMQYWKLDLAVNQAHAGSILAVYDSAIQWASLPDVLSRKRVGIWQAWGDSSVWQQAFSPVLLTGFATEAQASAASKAGFLAQYQPSVTGSNDGACFSGRGKGILVSVRDTAPLFATSGQFNLRATEEHFSLSYASYALDRHDLVHRYQPQYDSAHQQWYLRTDSLTWYYHKVGAYNWPCQFRMTSLRTAMNADGTPGCTDTLRATLSLLHLSPGQPAPEVRRQLVDLFHLPTAFPPVDEAFRQKYRKEE